MKTGLGAASTSRAIGSRRSTRLATLSPNFFSNDSDASSPLDAFSPLTNPTGLSAPRIAGRSEPAASANALAVSTAPGWVEVRMRISLALGYEAAHLQQIHADTELAERGRMHSLAFSIQERAQGTEQSVRHADPPRKPCFEALGDMRRLAAWRRVALIDDEEEDRSLNGMDGK